MKKTVVLAEKPSVGRDIARVLGCTKRGNGYLEGSKYIVTWALGHLVTLAAPETYDEKYKTWDLNELPMLPPKLELTIIKKTSKQYHAVKSQLHRKDVKDLIIATDAGREGELVARWILEKARVHKPVKRLWISSVTDKAIRDGFKQLKQGSKYEDLYASAVARSEADWYVGLNATRALTTKFNAQLSAGRVQTPTLAIIATRENEINTFKPRTFYEIEAKSSGNMKLRWQDEKNNHRIYNKDRANQLISLLNNKQGQVTKISKKHKKIFSPQLYDLTELQRDANRIFGFSGMETLRIMQSLYERHKILTYPRTDSRVITTDIVPTIDIRLKACGVDHYARRANKLLGKERSLPKSVVDNNKVTDHHAIIPTEEPVLLDELNDKEKRIYDLVIKRFFAVLSHPHEYEEVTLLVTIGNERFSTSGRRIVKQGWKEIYNDEDVEKSDRASKSFRNMKQGDSLKQIEFQLVTGETKAPSRFTEGNLLQAMENPARYMEAEEKHLARTINEVGGLGTVATRADIIEKLFNSNYLEMKGKHIHLTSKGKQLLELVPEDLRSPALTAEWEQKLGLIAEGKWQKDTFVTEMKEYTKEVVREIKNSDTKFKHDNITGSKCPDCDKLMLEVNNRNGKMLVCQDRSCGYKRNVFKRTNARCPDCRKRLELHGQGEGQTFICKCGHREKLTTFNKRRKQEKKHKVSKKEVNRYLNKQEDNFTNNALAEALAKFKK